jgi:transposase
MVVEQVRSGRKVAEVTAAVEVAQAIVCRWVRQDRIDRGEVAGRSSTGSDELLAARRRITDLESELATVKPASALRRGSAGARKRAVRDRGYLGG